MAHEQKYPLRTNRKKLYEEDDDTWVLYQMERKREIEIIKTIITVSIITKLKLTKLKPTNRRANKKKQPNNYRNGTATTVCES